ncbi:unnamed protein product [Amaranthus hypochondriacus]
MSLARLALKNLHQKTGSCVGKGQGWRYGVLQRLSSSAASDGKEVAVQVHDDHKRSGISSKWKSLLPRTLRKPISLWRKKDDNRHLDLFPPASFGNALLEAAENMNRLFENVLPSQLAIPSQLMGKFKETDESYKLKFDMPGLTKEDVKVTIDDGVLRIRGERKVEDDEHDEEYYMSYGYYNTSLLLPDDIKQDDIKAELKDGVLTITVPKTESHGKNVKEVQID